MNCYLFFKVIWKRWHKNSWMLFLRICSSVVCSVCDPWFFVWWFFQLCRDVFCLIWDSCRPKPTKTISVSSHFTDCLNSHNLVKLSKTHEFYPDWGKYFKKGSFWQWKGCLQAIKRLLSCSSWTERSIGTHDKSSLPNLGASWNWYDLR